MRTWSPLEKAGRGGQNIRQLQGSTGVGGGLPGEHQGKRERDKVGETHSSHGGQGHRIYKTGRDQVQVSQLMERVQQSVVQVEKISSTVKEGSSDAFRLRAEELDKRERIVRDMEQRTAVHAKEVF